MFLHIGYSTSSFLFSHLPQTSHPLICSQFPLSPHILSHRINKSTGRYCFALFHLMTSRYSQFTFDIGKSAIKLFLRVMQIKGKLLLSVNTGYTLRNFARTVTECSLKFNV